MTKNHALTYNGAPYSATGELVHETTNKTSGVGRALCSCGEYSPELPTGSARRDWFKEHRASAVAAPVAAAPEAPSAPAAASAASAAVAAPVKPKRDLVQELAEVGIDLELQTAASARSADELEAPEPVGAHRDPESSPHLQSLAEPELGVAATIPFTNAVAKHFWRPLGRKGVSILVGKCFPEVGVTFTEKDRSITLQGPAVDVERALAAVQALFQDASAAFYVWKREDAAYSTLQHSVEGRRKSYRLTTDFFPDFATQYAAGLLVQRAEAEDLL